jgi:protein-tyrosine-phosphatase
VPDAIEAMRELGIDISGCRSKSVTPYLGQQFTYVISLCDRQQERTCPIFPGAIWRQPWRLENPAAAQDPGEHRRSVRRVRGRLRQQITEFVREYA